jgi:hypothetical protein
MICFEEMNKDIREKMNNYPAIEKLFENSN